MAFEVYQREDRARRNGPPTVTLIPQGATYALRLNRAAFHLLGDPKAVEYLWDGDARAVGIRAAGDGPDTYKVRLTKGGTTCAATAFARYIGAPEVTTRYPASMDGSILAFSLLDGRPAGRPSPQIAPR